MELVGVERDVVVFYKVAGQQAGEADEDFLHTLGRLTLYDGTLLGVLQVKQEYGCLCTLKRVSCILFQQQDDHCQQSIKEKSDGDAEHFDLGNLLNLLLDGFVHF